MLAAALLTACSCALPQSATVTPSPSPTVASPQHSPPSTRSNFLAIVGGGKNSSISLVASDGTVVATAAVHIPAFWMHTQMSWTSASRNRLYYLDGSDVRFLAPDGTVGVATRIGLGAGDQAGFAVSPDDSSIAVAIFNYTVPSGPPVSAAYKGMRLYVEDLSGGGHHVDIFTSATVAEFPIGWTGGRVILAVSEPRCCKAQTINPYDATSYQVVDPATGTKLASLCDGSAGPEGPIEPIGAICYHPNNAATYQRWDGSAFIPPASVPNPSQYLNAISPDGARVAIGQDRIWIFGPGGVDNPLDDQRGYVWGWLDDTHLVIEPDTPSLSVISVAGWTVTSSTEIALGGSYLGTFPATVT